MDYIVQLSVVHNLLNTYMEVDIPLKVKLWRSFAAKALETMGPSKANNCLMKFYRDLLSGTSKILNAMLMQ